MVGEVLETLKGDLIEQYAISYGLICALQFPAASSSKQGLTIIVLLKNVYQT
jgi:hypothetical protein